MRRLRDVAWYILPCAVCLALYGRGLAGWFRTDDFSWLQFHRDTWWKTLFSPEALGTIRPWSERLFFAGGWRLFGLQAWPFHAIVFATHFANLALMSVIGRRLTGSREAGLWAAILWTVNSGLAIPLGWVSCYNQVLCGFFLLLALYASLTGRRWLEWLAFLTGFGALETMLVYPALAAGSSPRRWRALVPMVAVSTVFVAVHTWVTPIPAAGPYAPHWTSAPVTLATYWAWSLGSAYMRAAFAPAALGILTAAIVWFATRDRRLAAFGLLWFAVTLAPVLPFRNHMMEYYLYLPTIGLAWIGGAAVARYRAAWAFIAVYLFIMIPQAWIDSRWNYDLTQRLHTMMETVEHAPRDKAVLLTGVDDDIQHHAIDQKPFVLVGRSDVYTTLSPGVVTHAIDAGQLRVFDVGGREVTAAQPRIASLPAVIEAGSPMFSYLLGDGWSYPEGDHRWIGRRASLRMAGGGGELQMLGYNAIAGMPFKVRVNGTQVLETSIPAEGPFDLSSKVNDSSPEWTIDFEAGRTFRPDPSRELGLSFTRIRVHPR